MKQVFVLLICVYVPLQSMEVARSFLQKTCKKSTLVPSLLHQEVPTLLKHATHQFGKVPGFSKIHAHIYTSADANRWMITKGYIYELFVAWNLHNHGHIIKKFNADYMGNGLARQIDIVTDQWAIECKNIQWERVDQSYEITKELERQFYEQHALVKEGHVTGITWYVIYSYNPIPYAWKIKFNQKGIMYQQGPYQ